MKLVKNNILIILSAFLVFHSIFVYLFFGTGIGKLIQTASTALLIPIVAVYIPVFFSRRFLPVNISILLLCIWIVISAYLSRDITDGIETSSFYGTLVTSLAVMLDALVIELAYLRGQSRTFLKVFYLCSVVYTLISILELPFADLGDLEQYYIIGTKFHASYNAIFMTALYCSVNPKPTGKLFYDATFGVHVVIALFISIITQCTTAMLGVFIMCAFIFSYPYVKLMSKPGIFLLTLIICDTFLLFFQSVLGIPVVTSFIENVLHEDVTLSTRTIIYEKAPLLILLSPIWGCGLGNSNAFSKFYIAADNLQNGLLDFSVQTGIIGTVLLIVTFLVLLRKARMSIYNLSIYAMLYTYIVMSSVEITFEVLQLVLAMMLFLVPKNYQTHEKSVDN